MVVEEVEDMAEVVVAAAMVDVKGTTTHVEAEQPTGMEIMAETTEGMTVVLLSQKTRELPQRSYLTTKAVHQASVVAEDLFLLQKRVEINEMEEALVAVLASTLVAPS